MNELFKALKNFKPRPVNNNFFVELFENEVIALTTTESHNTKKITAEEYKMVLTHGVENFTYKDKLEKKIKKKAIKSHYKILVKDSNGYVFYNRDPYWPTETTEGGYTWQTPSE